MTARAIHPFEMNGGCKCPRKCKGGGYKGLTGLRPVRVYGRGGRDQAGDAAERLSAAVLDAPAVAGRGGRRETLASPADGGTDHRNLVELVPAVVVAQPGRAGARAAATDALLPGAGVGTPAAGAPAAAPTPKRLHQPLGARRHSSEVIQPSGIRFLRSRNRPGTRPGCPPARREDSLSLAAPPPPPLAINLSLSDIGT